MEKTGLTAQQLVAKDLNEVLQLNPQINIDLGESELEDQIKFNAGEVYYKHPEHGTDTLQESTFAYLLEKGYLVEPMSVTAPSPKKGEGKAEKPVKEKPVKEKPVKEKPVKEKAPEAEKPANAEKVDPPQYTRSNAFVDALKKGGTKNNIVVCSDALYVQNARGKSKPQVAEAMFRYAMPSLLLLGFVEEHDGIFSLVK